MREDRTGRRTPADDPAVATAAAAEDVVREADDQAGEAEGPAPQRRRPKRDESASTEERPVPGVKHMPEPDAENIMPAEDEPGTL